MTLERVPFLLEGWRGVEVLYGDAAFYGGGRVTWQKRVSSWLLEVRKDPIDRPAGGEGTLAIGHAGEGTGEEFERALACLFGSVHFSDVKNVK